MRPGLKIDWEHLDRFQRYIYILREKIESNAEYEFKTVSGLLVADRLNQVEGKSGRLNSLACENIKVIEWNGLLDSADNQWKEFLNVLIDRAPNDDRLKQLISD